MNLLALMREDITELLVKIIEFANARQKVLIENITNSQSKGFIPKDLEVNEFCRLLNNAIDEHINCQSLIFCDTENIKFHINGSLQIKSVADDNAKKLLENNRDEYVHEQMNKLFENSLSQRIAAELLDQKKESVVINYGTFDCCGDFGNKKDFGDN
jgi:flagellar basal body rod protein FlgB